MNIEIKGDSLHLTKDFGLDVEETNPVYSEIGSQTIPATVAASAKNLRLLGWPSRLDSDIDQPTRLERVRVKCGAYRRRGLLHVTSARRGAGISFNIGFDNSTAYAEWNDTKLCDLKSLPVYEPEEDEGDETYDKVSKIIDRLNLDLREGRATETDWAIFPLAIKGTIDKSDWKTAPTLGILNETEYRGTQGWRLLVRESVEQEIDGEETEVSVPYGYGISPFLRAWRVLALAFEALGLRIRENPLRRDPDLARLVVLNNCADAICTGRIKYSDLMPDCTVKDFMHSLWVRFGLTYNIDYDAGEVDIRLIRDIIREAPTEALDGYLTGYPEILYENRQYVKLSAGTGLEGAAPDCKRFEDYIRGRRISSLLMGQTMASWHRTEAGDRWVGPQTSGPMCDDDPGNEWEDPEPWDPEPWEPDDPDPQEPEGPEEGDEREERDETRSGATMRTRTEPQNSGEPIKSTAMLAREWVTGRWALVDQENGRLQVVSSSWFDWDPQPEGLEAYELESGDECVPVGFVENMTERSPMHGLCPMYLKGARHYHTYIYTESGDGNEEGDTPLAFLFAYVTEGVTIGRLNCEGHNGHPIITDDGQKPRYSLYFQWRDGLFAQFWKGFDEILRHGNRKVEAKARLPKSMLAEQWPMFDVLTLQGVRCLAEKISYRLLPGISPTVDVEATLRTIGTQGDYDIDAEQGIPDFVAALRHLEWVCRRDFYDDLTGDEETTQAAFDNLRTFYTPPEGYSFSLAGLTYTGKMRAVSWDTDYSLEDPMFCGEKEVREYRAELLFDVHLVQEGSDTPTAATWRTVMVEIPYKVYLEAIWKAD